MRRLASGGFWRQRVRGVASLVLLTALIVTVATVIAWLALALLP